MLSLVATIVVLAVIGAGVVVLTRQRGDDVTGAAEASSSDTLRRSTASSNGSLVTSGSVVTAPPSVPAQGQPPAIPGPVGSSGTAAATDPAVEADRTSGTPVAGGSVVYALESETDGYNPASNRWGWSGMTVGRAIYDPLTAFDADGVARPYLAESVTPAGDLRSWTITVRSGVRFHNGDDLTADDVKTSLEKARSSPLVAPGLSLVSSIDVTSSMTLTVTTTEPWATFPALLTGQIGMVAAPSVYASASGAAPVGTGPFVFAEWQVDKMLKVTRNPSYWQAGKPYLDAVEFRPITDLRLRGQAAGSTADLAQLPSSAPAPSGATVLTDATHSPERSMLAMNTAVAPFDNQDARLAVALGIDRGRFDPAAAASGYLSTGSPFFSGSARVTQRLDRAAAQAHAEAYTRSTGKPLTFTIATSLAAESQKDAQMVQAMMKDLGVDVRLEAKEQTALITSVVTGSYQSALWTMFGGANPELDAPFLVSKVSGAPGSLSVNIPRFDDPGLRDAFQAFRSSADRGQQQAQMDVVQEQLATKAPWVFLHDAPRAVIARAGVHGAFAYDLPSGEHGFPTVVTFLGNVWRSP